jgi:hemoglobin/transferrin/lactoferrin receptor protein
MRTLNLEEVVISGNKIHERKSDIPHQIDLILSKQITRLSPLSSADVLAHTGAAFVQKSQQGGGSPVLRGFEANKVLLVIDGIRMNNAIYRSGHLQNIITTDPNMMERIEVLQGAGSVVYGTDAIGGVIAFFTRRPVLSDSARLYPYLKAYVRYSSANQGKTAHASFNLGSKKWASLSGFTMNDFGDLRSGYYAMKKYPGFGDCNFYVERINGLDSILNNPDPELQRQSGYRQLDFLQKFLFAADNGNRHTINLQLSTSSDVPRYDRLQTLSNEKPRFAEWYYGPQERMLMAYEWQKDQRTWWADLVRITPAVQLIGESRHDRRLGHDNRNSLVENLKVYSLNLDLFREVSGHEMRYGIELVHNSLQSSGTTENIVTGERTPIVSRYPDGTYSTAGVYFSHRWELLGKKLILSDGLRFSSVKLNASFDPAFYETSMADVQQNSHSQNLHLGAVSMLPKGFRLNVLLSTGFRNPNIDDLGKTFETNGGDLMIANPDLRPEQIFYREAGLTKKIGNEGFIQATAYFSNLTDAIVPRPFPYEGQDSINYRGSRYRTLANLNIGKAKVWGLSTQTQFKLAEEWTFRGNITYTKGRDLTMDVPLDHIPPLYGLASLAYEKNRWHFETYFLFNSWKRIEDYSPSGEDNPGYATPDGAPAWQTWNIRAGWQFSKRLRLQAGIENVMDLRYRTFASGINAPGRNFLLSLHFD